MNFIKRNLMLLVVLLITAGVSVYMVSQTFLLRTQVSDFIQKRNEAVNVIQEAHQKRGPSVNKRNQEWIKEDHERLKERLFEIQRAFCNPYRQAFQKFAYRIESTRFHPEVKKGKAAVRLDVTKLTPAAAEMLLLNNFAAYYRKLDPAKRLPLTDSLSDRAFLDEFFRVYYIEPEKAASGAAAEESEEKDSADSEDKNSSAEKKTKQTASADQKTEAAGSADFAGRRKLYESALRDFRSAIQEIAPVTVTEESAPEYLLDALGVPRTASIPDFKQYLSSVRSAFLRDKLIPGPVKMEEMGNYTIPDKVVLTENMIPAYILQLQIRKDLFSRIRLSGARNVLKFSTETPYAGEKNGNYEKHVYRFIVQGELPFLRKLVQLLTTRALERSMVYQINEISISRLNAEDVRKLIAASDNTSAPAPAVQRYPQNNGAESASLSGDWDKPLLGFENIVSAELQVSCLVYTGSKLARETKK